MKKILSSKTINHVYVVLFYTGEEIDVHSIHLTKEGAINEAKELNENEDFAGSNEEEGYYVNYGTVPLKD